VAFNNNVFPVVYVADLSTGQEIRDSGTAPDTNININGTANIAAILGQDAPLIPGDLSDIAFLDNTQIGYAIGKAGDAMVRLEYGTTSQFVGTTFNNAIDLLGTGTNSCQAPIGLVVSKTKGHGYVNCWVTRRLAVVRFDRQELETTVESTALPTVPDDESVRKGKRFFFTGRARWSKNAAGWSGCGSCHPDGLTDNITWVFPAGPRQTTSMDGSFSHGPGVGPQKQRIFNWTAVNDELHDFEINVRNVSNGLGAITNAAAVADCGKLNLETPAGLGAGGPLGTSFKFLADSDPAVICRRADWDDITNYVKTIVPPRALKPSDDPAVARGRALFVEGNCANCHGGAGWTLSRRPYNPLGQANPIVGDGATVFGTPAFSDTTLKAPFIYNVGTTARAQISTQPAIGQDTTGIASTAVAVKQVACALRNVGTYGILGSATSTTALEVRAVAAGDTTAQGRAGYNIPSLYGLAVGAPYLHHGQSPSLTDLFTNPNWDIHTKAGNPNFKATLNEPGKLADFIAFLLSIDASTAEFNIAGGTDVCPGTPGQSL
jgi:hypothetical protein